MACTRVAFARNSVISCENKLQPFPRRPEELWRQSGGGEAGAPGRAVLREEAQRLLHTPEVPLWYYICVTGATMCNILLEIMDIGHRFSLCNSRFTLTVALQ